MFRCEFCKSLVGPRISSHQLVVARREKTYRIARPSAEKKSFDTDRNGKSKDRVIRYLEVPGHEIVREIKVCAACFSEQKLIAPNPGSISQKPAHL